MPTQIANGIKLYYERSGSGEPMVLVHGSWVDHENWAPVVPRLSEGFDVVTYDRRGHSQSEAAAGQGSFDEDADDLAALINGLRLAPAHVVGNSGGAVIALRLAAKRPDMFRSLAIHEPPLMGLLASRPEFESMVSQFIALGEAVAQPLQAGDNAGGARRFVETIAFGPGAWETLPQPVRETFIHNAPTFLDETRDAEGLMMDLDALRGFDKPMLVTIGSASAPFFKPIAETLATALPTATLRTLDGAGHVPQLSHPDLYVQVLQQFWQRVAPTLTARK